MLFSKPGYCSSMLLELQNDDLHTDIVLHSDDKSISVHSAILSQCSVFLSELLATTGSENILLPGFSTVLDSFVSLVYTGTVIMNSEEHCKILKVFCSQLDMDISYAEHVTNDKLNSSNFVPNFNLNFLKVKTDIMCSDSQEMFNIRMPRSRIDRKNGKVKYIQQRFEGFKGIMQEEYNCSPVGPFEGPYDQNPEIPLSAQLPESKLDFQRYTNFLHPQTSQCKKFDIKKDFANFDELKKIESLKILEDSEEPFEKPQNGEKVWYTCTQKMCMIPCLCKDCNSQDGQCLEHNIKHFDLYDEKKHAFSVRSTDSFCCKERFFWHSYTLKYPGIPKNCIHCNKDLLHHKCYHLDFHSNCKFCKLYQYKLFPETADQLRAREVKEKRWYASVCPFCDKKFCEPYAT